MTGSNFTFFYFWAQKNSPPLPAVVMSHRVNSFTLLSEKRKQFIFDVLIP